MPIRVAGDYTRTGQAKSELMPYEMSLRDGGRYAVIEWTGTITPAEILASSAELIERAAAEGIDRLLVDVSTVTNRLSLPELFFTTEANAKLGPPRPRCAILGTADLEDDLRFVEDVGVNRGMPVRTFTREEDALAWLLA